MKPNNGGKAIVFGGFGALGSAISAELLRGDFTQIYRTTRGAKRDGLTVRNGTEFATEAGGLPPLDAAIWAQGKNANDSVQGLDAVQFETVMRGNVSFVAETLSALLDTERLRHGARLVVLSSVWETNARSQKFSYTVSKAAIGGLVRAAALDLAPFGMLVNAVMPGVVDTPMTRSMLSAEQIRQATMAAPLNRLVVPEEVARVVSFLASPMNTAITGQSIAVDLGMSVARAL